MKTMKENEIHIVTTFPRPVREIENIFIPLADGIQLAARIWLPEDAKQNPVPATAMRVSGWICGEPETLKAFWKTSI